MKIETELVTGFNPAFKAMRNPMNSWDKSDTDYGDIYGNAVIGEKDMNLSLKLQKAGPEHCKHLRMVMCWASITAPRFWWQEFDTYRTGVEKVSCSTMHKLMARPLTLDDFECEEGAQMALESVIRNLNARMETWKNMIDVDDDAAKKVWREIIEILPQSYLQKRTVMMSYASLRNIVRQRKGHKLKEWAQCIDWVRTLPYANELIFDEI